MAYSDFGYFNTPEALYKAPGEYEQVMKNESLRRASYMSEMDKFYASLKETQRQFNKSQDLSKYGTDLQYKLGKAGNENQRYGANVQLGTGLGQLGLGAGKLLYDWYDDSRAYDWLENVMGNSSGASAFPLGNLFDWSGPLTSTDTFSDLYQDLDLSGLEDFDLGLW